MNRIALAFTLLLPIQVMAQVPALGPKPAEAAGPYFGQKLPGKTPEMFAPGIISLTNRLVDHIAFSPDGRECFFSVWGPNYSNAKIYWTKCVDNVWTAQVEAPFSVGHVAKGPFFSVDGNKLYFGYGGPAPSAISMVQRTAQGWSDPKRLDAPVNSTYRDSVYSETASGVGYFSSNRPGGQGTTNLVDIWRTRQVPGQPLQVENLGATLNSTAADFDPCVAHDGSYLIFTSERPGRVGGSDLYVSFPSGDGWTAPVNLNNYCPGVNVAGCANIGPSLSPDERYLFFTRYSRTAAGEQEDIYWVENPVSESARRGLSTLKDPARRPS